MNLNGLIQRNTNTVYVDIDDIIMWLYDADIENEKTKELLTDIAVILQDKKEKMLNKKTDEK